MRVALAQINPTVGDFAGNRRKILEFVRRSASGGADLIVFPEMSLFGYTPADLLERASVVEDQLKQFSLLARELPAGIAVIFGLVSKSDRKRGKPFHNSAALLVKNRKPRLFHKELLPTYDVFDEARFVESGDVSQNFFTFKGHRILLTICEDIWGCDLPGHPANYVHNPLLKLKKGACDLVVNISASPFTVEKLDDRRHVVRQTARHFGVPVIYVNVVGGQDELIFDGGSFVMDAKGKILAQSLFFVEDLNFYDVEKCQGEIHVPASIKSKAQSKARRREHLRRALVLGIRDFVHKTGMERVHLGLSGGIDSAVVACLAVEALGPDKVTVVTMPGPFSAGKSRTLAESLAQNLGVRCFNLSIEDAYQSALRTLQGGVGEFEFGVVNENLQSRLRGLFLMAIANKENSMLLTTGNKSEYATGYATLYGDMCGGLAPIADLTKEDVYDVAELYNATAEVIPREIITRPPTAELRPNQTDQDTLPPYPELDRAVRRVVEEQRPARNATERWLLQVIARNEFKRWQAPPILKVSRRSFGRGRRFPIANRSRS